MNHVLCRGECVHTFQEKRTLWHRSATQGDRTGKGQRKELQNHREETDDTLSD